MQYYWAVAKCGTGLREVLESQIAIMDKYDPRGHIGLLVDEWGTWWDEEPGSQPGHLYQQNTMRDAMVAAFSLNTFHQYTRRIRMCNIAQMANVLQSMVLTKDSRMVLTPTYHVFRMYVPNMQARNIPLQVMSETFHGDNERDRTTPRSSPYVSASASRQDDGTVNINLANADLKQRNRVTIRLDNIKGTVLKAEILTADNMQAHNTFDHPDTVKPKNFKAVKADGSGTLTIDLPPMSIVCMQVK